MFKKMRNVRLLPRDDLICLPWVLTKPKNKTDHTIKGIGMFSSGIWHPSQDHFSPSPIFHLQPAPSYLELCHHMLQQSYRSHVPNWSSDITQLIIAGTLAPIKAPTNPRTAVGMAMEGVSTSGSLPLTLYDSSAFKSLSNRSNAFW